MSTIRRTNWIYVASLLIVYGFLIYAARMSYGHIEGLALWAGTSRGEAQAAPIFVDGFVFLGWLGRRRRFAAHTRGVGLRLMIGGSLVSLVCNIGAGHTLGSRVFGGMIVAGYMVAEWYSDQLAPAEADPARQLAEAKAEAERIAAEAMASQAAQLAADAAALAAKRQAAAVQAAATRKANAARKAELAAQAQAAAELAAQERAAERAARRAAPHTVSTRSMSGHGPSLRRVADGWLTSQAREAVEALN